MDLFAANRAHLSPSPKGPPMSGKSLLIHVGVALAVVVAYEKVKSGAVPIPRTSH